MTPRSRAILSIFLVVGAAWSCRRVSERHAPPLAGKLSGSTVVTATDKPNAASRDSSGGALSGVNVSRRPASDGRDTLADAASAGTLGEAKSHLRLAHDERTWTFQDPKLGRIDVVVTLPDRQADERFPILVALHGRGEALKGPERGARGWVDDYALVRAMQRLGAPPLTSSDFEGIVSPKRLDTLNRELAQQPYRGLVVLCPYTPDLLSGDKPFEHARPYAQFLVETLLPRARRELPVFADPQSTGIDGVSLGGRIGFLSGLFAAEHFHSVAGLQAAFDSEDAAALGRLGDDAFRRNGKIRFRLLTSDRDYFIEANQAIAAEFQIRRLPMEFLLVPGPHDYTFNRGPGAIEMLFFHDRVLRENSTTRAPLDGM